MGGSTPLRSCARSLPSCAIQTVREHKAEWLPFKHRDAWPSDSSWGFLGPFLPLFTGPTSPLTNHPSTALLPITPLMRTQTISWDKEQTFTAGLGTGAQRAQLLLKVAMNQSPHGAVKQNMLNRFRLTGIAKVAGIILQKPSHPLTMSRPDII